MYNRVRSMIGMKKTRGDQVRGAARARRRLALDQLEDRRLMTGTWTKLVNPLPGGDTPGTMLQLTDGTVIAQGGGVSNKWYKLTPDSSGNYVDGTWTQLANSNDQRLYYSSQVLEDGRLFVAGGEYDGPSGSQTEINTGEIYDPVANTWTNIPNFPMSELGDAISETLPDGRVLDSQFSDTFIYNPATNKWTPGPTIPNNDSSNEEGWVKLADGSTLDYQIQGTAAQSAVRLVLGATDAQDAWVAAGQVPVSLGSGDDDGDELGPSFLEANGDVFWIGASNHTATYTPPSAGNPEGSWVAGPDQSDASGKAIGAFDAPGAIESNGKIIWTASKADTSFPGPTTILEYDPTTNAITTVSPPTGADMTGPAYTDRMLMLPTGQVLFTDGTESNLYLYNADSPALSAAVPTVTGVTLAGSTYTLTGLNINGINQGAAYGDDAQMSTNYPLVKLTDATGKVTYAKTTNWSSNWVMTGNTPETVQFTLPAGAPQGTYTLNVVANGVSSPNTVFNTHPLTVTAVAPTDALEDTSFSSEVATFTDSTIRPVNDYTATINWGDNSAATPGQIQALANQSVGGSQVFEVIGQHTYAQGGPYQMTVTVTAIDGTTSTSTTTVQVAGLPITAAGSSLALKEGESYQAPLATFADSSPVARSASFYSASITFGDDHTTVAGDVVADPSGGFDVMDTSGHTYNGGAYQDTITITKPGYATSVATALVVQDSPLASQGFSLVASPNGQPFTGQSPVEGQPYTGVLAEFNDADPRHPPAGNYYASIDYGDGSTPVVGKIVSDPNGDGYAWAIEGNKAFSAQPYAITIAIGNYSGGNTTVAYASATVTPAPLTAQSYNFTPTAGQTFTGYVASFSSADPQNPPIGDFSASINWGDGITTPGKILINTDGGYLVQASHAYTTGSYVITTSILSSSGAGVTVTGTATVGDASMSLTLPASIGPAEVGVPFNGVVADFTTPNNLSHPADYAATITWGDGTTSPGTIATSGTYSYLLNGTSRTGQSFVVEAPGKVFAGTGSYPLSVALTSPGGTVQLVSGTVKVVGAPVTLTPLAVSGTSRTALTNVLLGGFSSQDSVATTGDFAATLTWGDGTTSTASIEPTPAGIFLIEGSHTYAEGGTYSVGIALTGGSSAVSVTTTATIANQLTTINGNVVSTGGTITATGMTNTSTPTIAGTAAPLAKVTITATDSSGVSTVVGTGQASSTGAFAITTSPLGNGQYTLTASATDPAGQPSSSPTTLYPTASKGPLTVDTQGPKVASVKFSPATGKFTIAFSDNLSGLSSAGLFNAANYSLTTTTGQSYAVSGITVSPLTPQTAQTVTLSFNTGGKALKKGTYILQINAAGVTDNAGNALDERYYVPFPGLYNSAGQNYVAAFNVAGTASSDPQQYVPPAQVKAAAKHRLFVRTHFRKA